MGNFASMVRSARLEKRKAYTTTTRSRSAALWIVLRLTAIARDSLPHCPSCSRPRNRPHAAATSYTVTFNTISVSAIATDAAGGAPRDARESADDDAVARQDGRRYMVNAPDDDGRALLRTPVVERIAIEAIACRAEEETPRATVAGPFAKRGVEGVGEEPRLDYRTKASACASARHSRI